MRRLLGVAAMALLVSACGGGGRGSSSPVAALPFAPSANGSGPAPAVALPHFTVIDLGPNVQPAHVNDAGQVVGAIMVSSAYPGTDAFFWSSGALKTLTPLSGFSNAAAFWINGSGEIVGDSLGGGPNFPILATRWTTSGMSTDLGVPPNEKFSEARSVNDSGTIVGGAWSDPDLPSLATEEVATFNGSGTASGYPSNSPVISVANAINNTGEIAGDYCCPYGFPDTGTQAFFAPPYTILPMPANSGDGASARDINDAGHVVGFYSAGPFNRYNTTCCGFYYHGGTVTEIDDPSGGNFLRALAINNSDLIVGGFGAFANNATHAFVYDGAVVDLNSLIPANCNWVLNEATSINSTGEIVGTGTLNGSPHGFLLKPSP